MPQLYAPEFLRKLHLLIAHSDLKNIAGVAAAMNVKEPTLRSWTKDHTVRAEGTISRHGRDPVIKLFSAHLSHLSEEAVIELLEGPFDDLAAAFFLQKLRGLGVFIDREARFNDVKLVVDHEESSPAAQKCLELRQQALADAERRTKLLVTIRPDKNFIPTNFVPLGTDFRLEVPMARRAKYFLGLQKSPQGWAVIPAAPAAGGKIVHMPAADEPGKAAMMCEDHDQGASRFTLIQSMQPFPDFIHVNLQDGVPLSRTDIGFLARHLRDISKADRTLHAIDIAFFAM